MHDEDTNPWRPAVWLGAALLASACGSDAPPIQASEPAEALPAGMPPLPDVLVVCVEGLGPTDVALLGAAAGTRVLVDTPAFDQIVREGVVYDDVYASSPWAAEALLGALSGFTDGAPADGAWVPNLAESLEHEGYSTALVVGSERHLPVRDEDEPDAAARVDSLAGFDALLFPEGSRDAAGARASDVLYEATRWIAATRGPQFLVCTFADPAPPHHAYDEYGPDLGGGDPAAERVPSGLPHAELLRRGPAWGDDELARLRALHASEVGAVDAAFGRLARIAIDRREVAPVLVLAGLRAPALGEGGRFGHVPSLVPDALRVPLIVRFPADFGPHRQPIGLVDQTASLVDLGPTLLDALGFDLRLDLDGRSLFPGAERDDGRVVTARTHRGLDAELRVFGSRATVEVSGPGAPSTATFERDPDGPWEPETGPQ